MAQHTICDTRHTTLLGHLTSHQSDNHEFLTKLINSNDFDSASIAPWSKSSHTYLDHFAYDLSSRMRFILPLLSLALASQRCTGAAVIAQRAENEAEHIAPTGEGQENEEAKWAALKAYEDSMKYFHEPGNTDLLGHYDTRFYKGLLSYDEKRDTQVHMMRAYLETFREKGIETWVAHGTLLGWWWNGKA